LARGSRIFEDVTMPMPSLFKYFAFVGMCLLGLLTLVNFLLEPSTGATNVTQPKPVVSVQHDPRASKIERWRTEQAALKAAEQTQSGENASLAAKSTVQPTPAVAAPIPAVQPAQAEPTPAQQYRTAATEAAPAAQPDTVAEQAEADRAAKLAEQKAKIARSKARKAKLARERAPAALAVAGRGMGDRNASNQQDQYYYGQRSGGALASIYSSPNGYAPRQSYGPFGGWGRGW
jgi:hypothetical protein